MLPINIQHTEAAGALSSSWNLQTEAVGTEVPAEQSTAPTEPAIPAPSGAPVALQGGAVNGTFVRVFGTKFVDDDCREFFHTGWNGCVPEGFLVKG